MKNDGANNFIKKVLVQDAACPEATALYEIYQASFPKRELKSRSALFSSHIAASSSSHVTPPTHAPSLRCENYLYLREGNAIAALTLWHWESEVFVEYLAVSPACRNQQVGAFILQDIQKERGSVLLEIEVPEDELSERRYAFYRRLGFTLQTKNYAMPALASGQKALPMWLLRWPEKNTDLEDAVLEQQIHQIVYQIKN